MKANRSVRERYGLQFKPIENGVENIVVLTFLKAHRDRFGIDPSVMPTSQHWVAVCRGDSIYCVFGYKRLNERCVTVDDLYTTFNRWGTIAAAGALEKMREDADRTGTSVVTATPIANPHMRAFEESLGATHIANVYIYNPPTATAADDQKAS